MVSAVDYNYYLMLKTTTVYGIVSITFTNIVIEIYF